MGPGTATWDLGVTKNIFFTEQIRLQFRGEFFNLLNHANFASPATRLFDADGRADGSAGVITRTTTKPREIQFGLKLIF